MTTKAQKRRALEAQIASAQAELNALAAPEYVRPQLPGTVLVWTRTFPASDRHYTYAAVLRSDGMWQTTVQVPVQDGMMTWEELQEHWDKISENRWVTFPQKVTRFTSLPTR